MKTPIRSLIFTLVCAITAGLAINPAAGQAPPPPGAPEVVHYSKLIPFLPEAPAEWKAEEGEGQTTDAAGFTLTTVHRDYKKGDADNTPTASISILDSAANPEYAAATTATWKETTETPEGYTKAVTIDGNPGFETYEKEQKHAALWIMVAKRYFVEVELQNLDPKELQDWVKRLDLKKLAEVK